MVQAQLQGRPLQGRPPQLIAAESEKEELFFVPFFAFIRNMQLCIFYRNTSKKKLLKNLRPTGCQ
jgi:hypothetical protein